MAWGAGVDVYVSFALPVFFHSCASLPGALLPAVPTGACGEQNWRLYAWLCLMFGLLRIGAAAFSHERGLWCACIASFGVEAGVVVTEAGLRDSISTLALTGLAAAMMVAYAFDEAQYAALATGRSSRSQAAR